MQTQLCEVSSCRRVLTRHGYEKKILKFCRAAQANEGKKKEIDESPRAEKPPLN